MKKIIAIMLVLVMAISCTACGSAAKASDVHCPGFIGLEHLDTITELNNRFDAGELNPEYTVEMGQLEGYWAVYITGQGEYEEYEAAGFYDHMPSEEELDILWANRVPWNQLSDLMSGLGF